MFPSQYFQVVNAGLKKEESRLVAYWKQGIGGLVAGAAFVMLCGGCANSHRRAWAHETKDRAGLDKDRIDCEVKAGQAGYVPKRFDSTPGRDAFIIRCLEAEGWELQDLP